MEFNLTLFILQAVTFLIGMWLSSKIYLPYLNGWMQSRQKRIEDQLANAEKRQKKSDWLKSVFHEKEKKKTAPNPSKEMGLFGRFFAEKIIRSSVDAKLQEKLINENVQELSL